MKRVFSYIAVLLCVALLAMPSTAANSRPFSGTATRSGNIVRLEVTLDEAGLHSGQITVTYNTSEVVLNSANLGDSLTAAELTSLDTGKLGEIELGFASRTAVPKGQVLTAAFTAKVSTDITFTISVKEFSTNTTVDPDDNGNVAENNKGYDFTVTARTTTYVPPGTDPTPTPEQTTTPAPEQTTAPGPGWTSAPGPVQTSAPSSEPIPVTPVTPAPAPTADPSVTTNDVTVGNEVSTETTGKPAATVKDGVATSVVSSDMSKAILEQVERNDSDTVVLAPKVPEGVSSCQVAMPGDMLSELAKTEKVSVRVETPLGNVTLPNKAVTHLSDGKTVAVTLAKSEDVKDAIEVTITKDDKVVETVDGGIHAVLNLGDGQVAVKVDKDGNETVITKSVVVDGKAYVLLDGSATVKVIDNEVKFNDVADSSWYSDAVDFASSHNLFSGISTTEPVFAPDMKLDRAMTVTVLWKIENKEDPADIAEFDDVAEGAWYADAIAWASGKGIVSGYGNGDFGPADVITREQYFTMVYNYAKAIGLDTSAKDNLKNFKDADTVSSWAKEAMQWAIGSGLVSGTGDNTINPQGDATRAQAAALMENLIHMMVKV